MLSNYKDLIILCKERTEIDPIQRPKITKLIDYFYNYFICKDLNHEKSIFENNINETKFYPDWKCDECHFLAQFLNGYNQKTKERYSDEASNIHFIYQFELGLKYYPENYFHINISKFISCLNNISGEIQSQSQFYLGYIYYFGNYISRDINKSIHYFTLSANQNNSNAQYFLGKFYYDSVFVKRSEIKAINYLIQSSNNKNKYAHFLVGYAYHEDRHIKQDIHKAIAYYKEASNVNDFYAKNNLGINYKNGFSDEISPNIQPSIEYFQ